jgi:hypothetical protein
MNIAVCDFDLLVEAAFCHGGFVSETPKFLRGGLRRNYTRKIECRSLIVDRKHAIQACCSNIVTREIERRSSN